MSIYSGFPTRKDESTYNHLLEKLLTTMQAHLLEFVNPLNMTRQLSLSYSKIIQKMRQFEEHKYLQPKFSQLLQPLASMVGIPERLNTIHEHKQTKLHLSNNKQKIKTESSYSQNRFNSKKNSRNVTVMYEGNEKMFEGSHGGMNLWQVKSKTPKTQKDMRMTKTTAKQTSDNFYSIHERKIKKMKPFHRKLENHEFQDSSQPQSIKHKSVTQPDPYSPTTQFTKQRHCLDLKVLKDARDQLKKGEQGHQKRYKITEQISFPDHL